MQRTEKERDEAAQHPLSRPRANGVRPSRRRSIIAGRSGSVGSRRGLVSPTQGAPAYLLGRQRAFVSRQRHVRRLPAPREDAFVAPRAQGAVRVVEREQHNPGDCCRGVYYAATSLATWREHGVSPIHHPSGNLGNSGPACGQPRIAWPIGRVVRAHNVNRTVPDSWRAATGSRGQHSHARVCHGCGHASKMERCVHCSGRRLDSRRRARRIRDGRGDQARISAELP